MSASFRSLVESCAQYPGAIDRYAGFVQHYAATHLRLLFFAEGRWLAHQRNSRHAVLGRVRRLGLVLPMPAADLVDSLLKWILLRGTLPLGCKCLERR